MSTKYKFKVKQIVKKKREINNSRATDIYVYQYLVSDAVEFKFPGKFP